MSRARLGIFTRHTRLLVVIGIYIALACAYAWYIPILEGADEHGHAVYIDHLIKVRQLPEIGSSWEAVQPPLYYVFAASVVAVAGSPRLVPSTFRMNPAFSWSSTDLKYRTDLASYSPDAARPSRRLRLLSTLIGVVTLVLIYAAALQVGGNRTGFALGATALAALTPQFAHHHAVITNDSLSTMWCALLTMQLMGALSGSRKAVSSPAAMGIVVGLGVLTKYTIVPVAVAVVLVLLVLPGGLRTRLNRVTRFAVFALVVCGGWLAWNTYHYGDPLAQAAMRRAHAALAVDRSLVELLSDRRFLMKIFRSYWGTLGSMTIPLEDSAYSILTFFSMVGVAGIPLALFRRTVQSKAVAALIAIVALTWLAFLIHNSHLSAAQGRLLFPALPAISILLLVGWMAIIDAILSLVVSRDQPAAVSARGYIPSLVLIICLSAINIQTLSGPVRSALQMALPVTGAGNSEQPRPDQ